MRRNSSSVRCDRVSGAQPPVLAQLHEVECDLAAARWSDRARRGGRRHRRALRRMTGSSDSGAVGAACAAASCAVGRSVLACAFCSAFSTMDMGHPRRLRSTARTFCCRSRLSRNATASAASAPPTSAVWRRYQGTKLCSTAAAHRAEHRKARHLPQGVLGREHGPHLLQQQGEAEPRTEAREQHQRGEQRALRPARCHRHGRRLDHAELDVLGALVGALRDAGRLRASAAAGRTAPC